MLPWILLALVMLAWDVLGLDTGYHTAHLTVSALSQAFRPLDAGLLLVWMLVGLGYGLTRARSPQAGEAAGARAGHAFVPALLLPDNRAAGVAFWVACLCAAVVIDLVARRSRGRLATAEQCLRLATNPPVARAILVLAWTYAGYHLFGR